MMPINFGNGVTMFMPLGSFYDGADGTFPDISIYWLILWMAIGTILYVVVCYQFLCITHETTSIKEIVRQTNLIADDPIERLIIGMLVFLGFWLRSYAVLLY